MKKIAIAIIKGRMGIMTIFTISIIMNLYTQERSSVLLDNGILVMKTEGIAFLGSGMSEDDAKTFAINDAKRNALEQAGTYLEANTTVLNYQLVKDEVITFSAGLVKVKVLREARTLINNMFAFQVDIEAAIDTKLLDERVKELRRDSALGEQLEAEREKVKQLEAKIADLQTSGSTASKQAVKNVLNELSAVDWFNKGFNTKDNNLKIDYYTNAIELNPNDFVAYNNRGVAYDSLVNYNAAIRDYNQSIALNPQYALAHNNRGAAYGKLGNQDAAIQDYSRAIELDPQIAEAYNNRGIALNNLGKPDAAVRDYNRAIELNPQFSAAYNNRANALNNLGDYHAGIRDCTKAIELNPQYVFAFNNRGFAHYNLGNYDASIRDYTKAIELNPQNAFANINRGLAFKALNNKKAAADDFNSYLRINGNNAGNAEQVRQWIRDLDYTPQY